VAHVEKPKVGGGLTRAHRKNDQACIQEAKRGGEGEVWGIPVRIALKKGANEGVKKNPKAGHKEAEILLGNGSKPQPERHKGNDREGGQQIGKKNSAEKKGDKSEEGAHGKKGETGRTIWCKNVPRRGSRGSGSGDKNTQEKKH